MDQLSEAELDWLDKFSSEYYGASFQKDGNDIQDYQTYGKDANDRNNARNRDLYGALKNKDNKFNNKKLLNYDSILEETPGADNSSIRWQTHEFPEGHDPRNLENTYIDFIESIEIKAMLAEYDEAMKNFTEEPSEVPPQHLPES